MLEKKGVYELKEANYIGQIGEIIARCILEKVFPSPEYEVVRSNTYPYSTSSPCMQCKLKFPTINFPESETFEVESMVGPDFAIANKEEKILVEVKTTLQDTFRLCGSKNRKYFGKQISDWKEKYPTARLYVLFISLANFPKVAYKLEER